MAQQDIRNFSIIAHVDHGKSTLSDRLLEFTGTVAKREMHEQLLDSNPIERERGVTIKLAPVTMEYMSDMSHMTYTLNLIDTPGHVDFSYEVERSLAACEGAILLVDATQGIQAQTLAHAQKAAQLGLTMIPVLNKIDLESAHPDDVLAEMHDMFGFKPHEISRISAKTGMGIPELLERIVKEIPPPSGKPDRPLRALIFNSVFDIHLGVIAFVRVVDGMLDARQELCFLSNKTTITPKEIGVFTPERTPTSQLETGQVGYIATGFKDIRHVKVGDTVTNVSTIHDPRSTILPLPGYQEPKPNVYADVHPGDDVTYQQFLEALGRLKLSDASLVTTPIFSPVLGPGLRIGFLGLFHIEITKERLLREYGVSTLLTLPTVEYHVTLTSGKIIEIKNANDLPDPSSVAEIREPMTRASIFTPTDYIGPLMQIIERRRGVYDTTVYLGKRAKMTYNIPLSELISGLFDEIKSVSRGFATLDYELTESQPVDATKLTILVNHEPVETLSRIVVKSQAERIGRDMVGKLKDLLPPQQFAVPIQATIWGNIVAREDKKSFRKDVIAKLYGGDQTRKDKLLKKQKKGKKKMAQIGKVNIPDDVITKLSVT